MTLSNEIQEATQKQLPNMVASELQAFIKAAEEDRERLEKARISNALYEERIREQQTENARLRELELDAGAVIAAQQQVAEDRRDLKVVLAEAKATAATEKCATVIDLVRSLFRNTEYRKTMNGGESTPVRDQYGNQQYLNKNETITEEQI